mmetsp:Transcript_27373/g.53369  ORF Transcript_27373/g.53369 Transcript_27373/m.53369 type:complete len:180 (-) Transcript_27373:110-649(-)
MFTVKNIALASIAVASVSAFQAPAAFSGMATKSQAACRSSGVTMAMEDGTDRRAALGALLAGALSIPAAASAGERYNSGYTTPKGNAENFQLRNAGVMTDVESSSMSGVRASGGANNGIDAKKKAAAFPRTVSEEKINKIEELNAKLQERDILSKYKTSNKVGINPGFGGSSGIFTGAK